MSSAGAGAPRRLRAARSALLGALLTRWAAAAEEGLLEAPACDDGGARAADPDLQAVLSWDDEFASLLSTKRGRREYFAGGGSSRRERVHQPTYATGVHHKTVPELQSDEEFSKDFVKDNQPGESTTPPASNETGDVASMVDGTIGGAADATNKVNGTIATTTTTTTTTTSTSTTTTTTMTTTNTATTTTTNTLDGATGAISSAAGAANDTLSSTLSDLCRRYNAPCDALKWLADALGSTSAKDSSEAAGTRDTSSTADDTIDSVVNDTIDGAMDAVSSAVDAANDNLSSAVDAVNGALKSLTDALEPTNANDSNKAGSTSTGEKPETTVTVNADAGAGEGPKHALGTSRRSTNEYVAIWLLVFVLIASGVIVFVALCMLG